MTRKLKLKKLLMLNTEQKLKLQLRQHMKKHWLRKLKQ